MARYLGANAVLKSPRSARTYTIIGAERWDSLEGSLRPPAHIIGVGGFGVTYRAVDDHGASFAMKEYYPRDHAQRNANGVIVPKRSEGGLSKRIYEEGLRRFIAEGHLLTSFDHPNLCRVVDAFDANGTSYQLMKLVEGREVLGESDTGAARIQRRVTLEDYLRELEQPDSGAPIDLALLEPIFRQLLDAVEYVHTEGSRKAREITGTATRMLLHRDIKPANILIEAPQDLMHASAAEVFRSVETKALLIDFGSARVFREASVDDASRSIGVVTEGYAPPELTDNDLEQQGPHTDIYSLAAVIWRAFIGRKPSSAQLANGARLTDLALPVRDAAGVEHPRAGRQFLAAIDKALNAGVSARPPSIAVWRDELFASEPQTVGETPISQTAGDKSNVTGQVKRRSGMVRALGVAGGFAAAYGLLALWPSESLETHIREQAELAYADAERLSSMANLTAETAEADAKAGRAASTSGLAKANEASAKYDRFSATQTPRRVFHDGLAGDEGLGDIWYPTKELGRVWCHRKNPGVIIPLAPYERYPFPESTVYGEPGWACAIGHTHLVPQTFDEPKNPWRVEKGSQVYLGEVDGETPSGHGTLTGDDLILRGRFIPNDKGVTVVGALGSNWFGVFDMTTDGDVKINSRRGEELQGGNLLFRGQDLGDRRLGLFPQDGGDRFLGAEADWASTGGEKGKWAAGRTILADGSSWYGHLAGERTWGVERAWGRLVTSTGVYHGEHVMGVPNGCGVWDRNGEEELGWYENGVRSNLDRERSELCRNSKYGPYISPSDFPQPEE